MPPPVKERTSRFLDIRAPAKSVGLWSHRAEFSTTLHPISPTRETLGRFFNDDLVRFETHAEALEMMRVKGWKKTAPQKLKEYAAQYLGERYDEQGRGEWIVGSPRSPVKKAMVERAAMDEIACQLTEHDEAISLPGRGKMVICLLILWMRRMRS